MYTWKNIYIKNLQIEDIKDIRYKDENKYKYDETNRRNNNYNNFI